MLPPRSSPQVSPAKASPVKPTTTATHAPRPSVVSPDSASSLRSSTARPRASVTEGVKPRPPPAHRASLAPTTPNRPSSSASVRTNRVSASVSSIKDVKDDNKVVEELKSQVFAILGYVFAFAFSRSVIAGRRNCLPGIED